MASELKQKTEEEMVGKGEGEVEKGDDSGFSGSVLSADSPLAHSTSYSGTPERPTRDKSDIGGDQVQLILGAILKISQENEKISQKMKRY